MFFEQRTFRRYYVKIRRTDFSPPPPLKYYLEYVIAAKLTVFKTISPPALLSFRYRPRRSYVIGSSRGTARCRRTVVTVGNYCKRFDVGGRTWKCHGIVTNHDVRVFGKRSHEILRSRARPCCSQPPRPINRTVPANVA